MTQQSIFDQTEQKKQFGIELVYRHADSYWKKAAAERLLVVIAEQQKFTMARRSWCGSRTGTNKAPRKEEITYENRQSSPHAREHAVQDHRQGAS